MTRFYRRRRPSLAGTLTSVAVAAGVAGATFYLTRILFSREPLGHEKSSGRKRAQDLRGRPTAPERSELREPTGPGRRPGQP